MKPGDLVLLSVGTEVGIEHSGGVSYDLKQDAYAILLAHQVLQPDDFSEGSDGWWVVIVGPGALHRPRSARLYVSTQDIMEV